MGNRTPYGGVSTRTDVVAFFEKEPTEYVWEDTTYTVDTLPIGGYIMKYGSEDTKDFFSVMINNTQGGHICDELRINRNNKKFRCANGIKIGLSSEEVFEILGEPTETLTGETGWESNVFYKNRYGVSGKHYYSDAVSGIRMFFANNITTAVYIFDDITAIETLK